MNAHDRILQLAAIAIDFPLPAADRARLEHHLAGCPACAGTAVALRRDAEGFANLRPVLLPERRAAEILDTVLHQHATRRPMRLLLAVALLGLVLVGGLAAGAGLLLRTEPEDLPTIVPAPSPGASAIVVGPDASRLPTASPSLTVSGAGVGVTWEPVALPDSGVRDPGGGSVDGVIAGGPGAIAWGSAYGLPPRIWTTADGRTWTSSTLEAPPDPDPDVLNPGTITGIVPGGPGYVALGWYDMTGNGRRVVAWTSVDGRAWALVPHDAAFDHAMAVDVVAWRGKLLAYGQEEAGSIEGMGTPIMWTSSDGMTWTRDDLQVPDGLRFGQPVVTTADALWAIGLPAADNLPELGWSSTRYLTSTDGRTWSVSALPRYPGLLYPTDGGLLTLVHGVRDSGAGQPTPAVERPASGTYRTPDRASWEQLSVGPAGEAYDLVQVGATLVAVGAEVSLAPCDTPSCYVPATPAAWRSTDGGRTWQQALGSATGGGVRAVAALPDGTVVGVGHGYTKDTVSTPAAWVSSPAAP